MPSVTAKLDNIFTKFKEVAENHHQYAEEWKARTGKKVVGYLCTYTPEEVLYAAGILPVRVTGSHQPQDITEAHIYNMFCPYCRDCLGEGLQGKYNYLDGIVHAFSCIHIRQTYDSWVRHIPTAFSHFIYVPNHLQSPSARDKVVDEVKQFKSAVESWLATAVTTQSLKKAVNTYNTNRNLMSQIYELRKQDNPPISGEEAMYMVMASLYMDKAEHNRLLRQLLAALPQRELKNHGHSRVMYLSSESDAVNLIRLIESLGADVVTDDNCIGTRYFMREVDLKTSPDILAAIANRYVDKPPCPVKDMVERNRLPHIKKLVQDYKINAAVYAKLKFCDPHEYDIPSIKKMLEDMGIPLLVLECDITIPEGQFRTRIEAFLEVLQFETV